MGFLERAKKAGQDLYAFSKNPSSLGDLVLDRVLESGIVGGKVGDTLNKIDQRGLIDIVPSDRKMAGILTKIKTGTGPLGRAFNIDIESSPDTMAYLQNQINRAKIEGDDVIYSHANGTAIKPGNFEDQQAMALVGQFRGTIKPDGTVTTKDTWDINSDIPTLWNRWHDKSIDPKDRTFYRNALAGKVLEEVGILNTKPFGEEFKIGYAPGTEQAKHVVQQNKFPLEGQPKQELATKQNTASSIIDGQLSKARQAMINTAVAAATPKQSQSYQIQRGDTLNKIAAQNNLAIDDLIKKNNISNPNLIEIGDTLMV